MDATPSNAIPISAATVNARLDDRLCCSGTASASLCLTTRGGPSIFRRAEGSVMIGSDEAVGELASSRVHGVATPFSIELAIRDWELAQARLLVSSTVEPEVTDVSTRAAGSALAAPAPSLVTLDTDAQKR